MKNLIIVIHFFSFLIFPLFSQDDSSSRVLAIQKMADSPDFDFKQDAISQLSTILSESPSEQDRSQALAVLTSLAEEGLSNVKVQGKDPHKTSGVIRAQAAEVLGLYGGDEAVLPLLKILLYDPDNLSVATAAMAAANLDTQNTKDFVSGYARILNGTRPEYEDERLVYTVLIAVETLGAKDENIYDNSDLIDGLYRASRAYSGYSRKTRTMAMNLIKGAKGGTND
ncbi:MAG: HEAT repeat domain-containing protein [Spirochaetales bacterium]|nr:HEAT repeat domain-containing protein [Spirochaetales bacterium]